MLNIKNPEAHALAKEIAAATKTTLTEAVVVALREKSEALKTAREAEMAERQAAIAKAFGEMRDEWRKANGGKLPTMKEIDDEIYDEFGLPK